MSCVRYSTRAVPRRLPPPLPALPHQVHPSTRRSQEEAQAGTRPCRKHSFASPVILSCMGLTSRLNCARATGVSEPALESWPDCPAAGCHSHRAQESVAAAVLQCAALTCVNVALEPMPEERHNQKDNETRVDPSSSITVSSVVSRRRLRSCILRKSNAEAQTCSHISM